MAVIDFLNNFRIQDAVPIDTRFVADNEAARLALPDGVVYEGLLVYQKDNNHVYVLEDITQANHADGWDNITSNSHESFSLSAKKANGYYDLTVTLEDGTTDTIVDAWRDGYDIVSGSVTDGILTLVDSGSNDIVVTGNLTGPQGPTGLGSVWIAEANQAAPVNDTDLANENNDIWLVTEATDNGDIYTASNVTGDPVSTTTWTLVGNIRGQAGTGGFDIAATDADGNDLDINTLNTDANPVATTAYVNSRGNSNADDLVIVGNRLRIDEDGTPVGDGIVVDSRVVENSTNLISSGGVFDSLDARVALTPSSKQTIDGETAFQGSTDFETNNGQKIIDISGSTGDVHFVGDGATENDKAVYIRSTGKLHYDPTNSTSSLTGTDANEIAVKGELSTLADEITAILIERNSAGQTLEQWEDAGNSASTFVADSANSITEVSLANNLNLLANDSYSKMIVATENGNDYHFDLLRFQALNGRLILQTDNLVTRLANIDTAITNATGTGLQIISAFSEITSPTNGQDVYLDTTDGTNQPGIYQYSSSGSEWVLVIGGRGVPFGNTLPLSNTGTIGELFRLMQADGNYQLGFYVRIANTGAITDWRQLGEERGNGAFPTTNLYDGRTFYLEQHDTSGTNNDTPAWYVYRQAAAATGTIGTDYQSAIAADWYVSGESIEATRIYPTLGDTTAAVNPDTIEDVSHVEQFEVTPGIWTFDGTVYIYNGIAHDIDTTQDLWDNAPLAPTTTDTYRSGWETWDNFVSRVEGGSVNAQATYSQVGVTLSEVSAENRLTFGDSEAVASFVENIGWPLGNQNFEIASGSSFNFEIVNDDGTFSFSAGRLGGTTNFIYDTTDTSLDHISFQTASLDITTPRTGTIRTNLAEAPVTDIVGGTNVTLAVTDGTLTINSEGGTSTGGGVDVETSFPSSPSVGDQIYLNVSVSHTDGANNRPRGFYTYIQPSSDPTSRFWEQVTLSEVGQLFNNARVGDIIYLEFAQDDFNTVGNNFQPGFYRAAGNVGVDNHTTWTSIGGGSGDTTTIEAEIDTIQAHDLEQDHAIDVNRSILDQLQHEYAGDYTYTDNAGAQTIFIDSKRNNQGTTGGADIISSVYNDQTDVLRWWVAPSVSDASIDEYQEAGTVIGLDLASFVEPIPFKVVGRSTASSGGVVVAKDIFLKLQQPDTYRSILTGRTSSNAAAQSGGTNYFINTANTNFAEARTDSRGIHLPSSISPQERSILDTAVTAATVANTGQFLTINTNDADFPSVTATPLTIPTTIVTNVEVGSHIGELTITTNSGSSTIGVDHIIFSDDTSDWNGQGIPDDSFGTDGQLALSNFASAAYIKRNGAWSSYIFPSTQMATTFGDLITTIDQALTGNSSETVMQAENSNQTIAIRNNGTGTVILRGVSDINTVQFNLTQYTSLLIGVGPSEITTTAVGYETDGLSYAHNGTTYYRLFASDGLTEILTTNQNNTDTGDIVYTKTY